MKQFNYGPTEGVPWDYVVPFSAVTELVPTKAAEWCVWGGGEGGDRREGRVIPLHAI